MATIRKEKVTGEKDRSDMLIKNEDAENVKLGDTFTDDGFPGERYDYMLANPPFGVEWKQQARFINDEHTKLGYDGRFGAGLPRINDGSLLFLQHMISKMRSPGDGGSRIGIVFNRSSGPCPLRGASSFLPCLPCVPW